MRLLPHVRCSPAPAGPPGRGSHPHRAPPGLTHGCSGPFFRRSWVRVLTTGPLCDLSAPGAAPLPPGGDEPFLFPSLPVFYSWFAHSSACSPPPAAALCTPASAAPALLPAAGSCSPAWPRPAAHGRFRGLDLPPRGWSWPQPRLPALQQGLSAWLGAAAHGPAGEAGCAQPGLCQEQGISGTCSCHQLPATGAELRWGQPFPCGAEAALRQGCVPSTTACL